MDKLDRLDDAAAAQAFRRLVRFFCFCCVVVFFVLMGLAGFCSKCLSDWIDETSGMAKAEARETIYGMRYDDWKAQHQREATPEQLRRMEESVAKNAG